MTRFDLICEECGHYVPLLFTVTVQSPSYEGPVSMELCRRCVDDWRFDEPDNIEKKAVSRQSKVTIGTRDADRKVKH